MITINVHEAKIHLSKYLNKVEEGEHIIICKRNRPIAEISPIPKRVKDPRPIGLAKGTFTVSADFFEPLPEEIIDLFAQDTDEAK